MIRRLCAVLEQPVLHIGNTLTSVSRIALSPNEMLVTDPRLRETEVCGAISKTIVG